MARRPPVPERRRAGLPVARGRRRTVLLRPGRAGDPRRHAEPGSRPVLHRPAPAARPGCRGHRHRRAHHGRTRSYSPGGFGGFGTARARRRLRDGRRPAGDRLVHAVQRRVPPVRRTAGHVPARAHPPAGRPGRARRAAAHGHHGLAAGRAALPGPARHRRRRRAGRGPAGARRPPGRRGPADAGGGGAAARRGAVADDRRVRDELGTPDVEFGGGDRHRGAGRLRGHRVVIANGLAGAPAAGIALIVAGGAGVLVLAARVFMLVRENLSVLGIWRESSRSLRDLANRTSDVVLVCDLDGVVRYASPAVEDYGYPPGTLTGRRLLDFVHPEDRPAVLASVRLALGGYAEGAEGFDGLEGSGRFPVRVRAADGTWRHVESTLLRYQAPGEPVQMLVTARDVSDQVALRQQVTHLTFHDGLTGLPNRAYVEERARDMLHDTAVAARTGVIFLDLDRFTAVNDSVGHGAGDLVLAQAARRLRAVVPVHDTVARWGSDEFAILVENAGGAQEVAEIAERLAGAIGGEPFRVGGQQLALTASVGVALADVDPPGLVLRNADVAMARAKDAGGDRVEVYAAHMHADVVRRLEIVSDLQQAIGNGELTLQYQPIVELATSRVTGAEALVRWWRGDQMVPPQEFLGAAEESGLIVPLGEWVLREACAQGAAWRRSSSGSPEDVGVSVNLSPRQITAPAFTTRVSAILADTGLPPGALTVEVNERVLVEEDGLIVERLAELRRLGVRMAIDDFGTGYASLAYLRRLPLDIIKIDPSFVAGLGQDDTLTLLTKTVVQVGRDLGLRVIAEGIEQPRQLTALREMGCCYGQGFLVARPMDASGVEALIKTLGENPEAPTVSECETTRVSG